MESTAEGHRKKHRKSHHGDPHSRSIAQDRLGGGKEDRSNIHGTLPFRNDKKEQKVSVDRPSHHHSAAHRLSRPSNPLESNKRTQKNPSPSRRHTIANETPKKPSSRHPTKVEGSTSISSPSANRKQISGLLTSIQPLRNTIVAVPEKMVECIICLSDDIPSSKAAKLACGHRMCHSCLKRQFKLSISDPQLMPPTCCTKDHIPLKHVEKLLDDKFKRTWNKKYEEYTTKNRLYCPVKNCGTWIKSKQIKVDKATLRKYGKCGNCKTKVCCICNGKWHAQKECPKDPSAKVFNEMAKDKGWQRCYNCGAMVELKDGCNHMTCRCLAQFCMQCGSRWKTCDCPLFLVPREIDPVQNIYEHFGFGQRFFVNEEQPENNNDANNNDANNNDMGRQRQTPYSIHEIMAEMRRRSGWY